MLTKLSDLSEHFLTDYWLINFCRVFPKYYLLTTSTFIKSYIVHLRYVQFYLILHQNGNQTCTTRVLINWNRYSFPYFSLKNWPHNFRGINNSRIYVKYLITHMCMYIQTTYPRSGDNQCQETFSAPSADNQTSTFDKECSNHHPSLSKLRSEGFSRSKMKWWTIYTQIYQ